MPCIATNNVVLKLKIPDTSTEYDFSPLYPVWSKELTPERDDPQGPAVLHKVSMNIKGFFVSETGSHKEIIDRYLALETFLSHGNLLLNHSVGATVLASDKIVYTSGIQKPEDWDTWTGEYSFNIYYFQEATDHFTSNGLGVTATYVTNSGTYTFEKAPQWGRKIKLNRGSHRAENVGSTAFITLRGKIYANDHASLMTKINELESAFIKDGVLNYGSISVNARAVDIDIAPAFIRNYASYTISLAYDLYSETELRVTTRFTRVHNNVLIKEKPLCNERSIQLMNRSGQTVTWNISVKSDTISNARALLGSECVARITSGGYEIGGGEETWDENEMSVSVSITKFFDTPILENLSGTGE
jgi:hypothetical protein